MPARQPPGQSPHHLVPHDVDCACVLFLVTGEGGVVRAGGRPPQPQVGRGAHGEGGGRCTPGGMSIRASSCFWRFYTVMLLRSPELRCGPPRCPEGQAGRAVARVTADALYCPNPGRLSSGKGNVQKKPAGAHSAPTQHNKSSRVAAADQRGGATGNAGRGGGAGAGPPPGGLRRG